MLSSSASAAIELDMDHTAAMRRRKSLAVLQKIDPKVLEIVFDCPHVAIYRFIVYEQETRWERLGVEGALFITANASDDHPAHSLIVLNRRGPLDFILDISTVMKISLQAPYLMLLCSSGEERSVDSSCIFGIWVHDASELQSINSIIDRTSTSVRKSTASARSSATKADRLLSLLRPPIARQPVATDYQSDYPKATPNQTTTPERLEADHSSGESTRSRDITAATTHLTSNTCAPNLQSPSSSTVLAKSKRLLSILKKAPPPGLDGETDHLCSSGDTTVTTTVTPESIAVQEECSGVDSSSSSSCRRAQLFSLLRQPAPPPLLLSSQSSDASNLQRSDQDREKLLRLLRPAIDQLPASELLTDSQIARKRANVTTTTASARHVVDEKRDKLQSLLLGKGKTSNNHADIIGKTNNNHADIIGKTSNNHADIIIQHPDQSAAVAVSSTSTCRTVKLISPSDLKAFGYR